MEKMMSTNNTSEGKKPSNAELIADCRYAMEQHKMLASIGEFTELVNRFEKLTININPVAGRDYNNLPLEEKVSLLESDVINSGYEINDLKKQLAKAKELLSLIGG